MRSKKKEFRVHGLEKDETIIGLLLSDSHLTSIPNKFRNSRFTISQSTKYEEMIDFITKYLNDLGFNTTKKSYMRKTGIWSTNLSSSSYPELTLLRKLWYPDEFKIVPRSLKLTDKSLAFWFMGDGTSRFTYKNFIVEVGFCTESFRLNDCLYLKSELERLGIKSRINRYKNGFRIYVKHKESVIKLMSLVKPYMIQCYYYKVKIPELSSHFNAWKPAIPIN